MLWAKTKGKTILDWPLNANQLRAALPNMTLPKTNAELDTIDRIEADDGVVYLGVEPAIAPAATKPLHKVGLGKPTWNEAGDGLVRTFVEAPRSPEEIAAQWEAVRIERKKRMAASDWTQLPDVNLPGDQAAAVLAYRQALRDITEQPDPYNLTWPDKPIR